jgi:uncharacterized protein YraI
VQAAPVYLYPDTTRPPLLVAAVGSTISVVKIEGDWLNIVFDDSRGWQRVGYVQIKFVKLRESQTAPVAQSRPSSASPTPTPARATPGSSDVREKANSQPQPEPRSVAQQPPQRLQRKSVLDVQSVAALTMNDRHRSLNDYSQRSESLSPRNTYGVMTIFKQW